MNQLQRFIPFFGWIKDYSKQDFVKDLPAGITVGVMLIPQGMAYAMIAGLPPIYGLYAALVPTFLYAFFGTSRHLSIGPVAIDSLLVGTGLGAVAIAGTDNYIQLALTLAFLVGLIQILLGVLRLGFIVNFLSKPVITAFTSAAAFIIGLSQLKHLIGVDLPQTKKLHEMVYNAAQNFDKIHYETFVIGVVGIIILKSLKKWFPKVPGALVVVVLGIVFSHFLNFKEMGVKVLGAIPEGLPGFNFEHFNFSQINLLLPTAITVALIGFMENYTLGKTLEEKHKYYKMNANKELIALGIGNTIGSFFKSYPTTAGLARSAVNDLAGAKTPIASIIASILIALTLLFLTPLFYDLPNPVLASIIMVAVISLINVSYPKYLWKNRKDEFLLFMATFLLTLFVGIIPGILIGVLLSLILLVHRTTAPHYAVLGQIPNTKYYKNVKRFDNAIQRDEILIVRFDAQLYFANKDYFKEKMERLVDKKGEQLELFILSAESINYIDSSAMLMLKQFVNDLKNKGVKVYISAAIGPVRDIFEKSGLNEIIPIENQFIRTYEAIEYFDSQKS